MWIFQREKKHVLCREGPFSKLILFRHCGLHKQNACSITHKTEFPCAPFVTAPFPTTPVPGILTWFQSVQLCSHIARIHAIIQDVAQSLVSLTQHRVFEIHPNITVLSVVHSILMLRSNSIIWTCILMIMVGKKSYFYLKKTGLTL